MPYLVVETNLFVTDIPDSELDEWSIGADCAGWLYARLLPNSKFKAHTDPTMEDWGWLIALKVEGFIVQITVYGHQKDQDYWIIGIACKNRFWKRCPQKLALTIEQSVMEAIEEIVDADVRMKREEWVEDFTALDLLKLGGQELIPANTPRPRPSEQCVPAKSDRAGG
ncbi:hypothetical protein [Roseibacillus persicicus]|uniref:hypothetical protein n=1 Tax=Roseibacillus persicicus TaxID=454148 RepID=UPI00280E0F11|nr:hypothetical protein [Roseibacillus persicicus]MDQ8192635.1 hypothetical protein [Roseibacillus persicicus]